MSVQESNGLYSGSNPRAVRFAARAGNLQGQTSGLAAGYVQVNLAIFPADLADAFLRFCHSNPKSCPVLGLTEPGSVRLPALGDDIDLRTDVPRYRVWRDGEVVSEPTDVCSIWRNDLVAFAIGCSFSFEEALIADGIPMKHVQNGCNVPMYSTNVPCATAEPFAGPLVVSMRPLKAVDAIRAIQITSRFPAVHGAPVHLGNPALIGIRDLSKPDYGEAVKVEDDEIPVFWACGVTPQSVISAAKVPFAITHSPGCMLVTDLTNSRLAAL